MKTIVTPAVSAPHNSYYPEPHILEQTARGERGYDLRSRLLKERIVLVSGVVDDAMATSIAAQMLFLDAEDTNKPIMMYINSPGGAIHAGMMMVDTMNHIKSAVHTICWGMAASMGAILLTCGEKGHRMALPNAWIMIHQPMGGAQGQASDVFIAAKHMERVRDMMVSLLMKQTGKTRKQMLIDIDRDNYMIAAEAVAYGLIDKVV